MCCSGASIRCGLRGDKSTVIDATGLGGAETKREEAEEGAGAAGAGTEASAEEEDCQMSLEPIGGML